MEFELKANYTPTGDQPNAIKKLTESIQDGNRYQLLLGVTGSGKTFTMANVIQNLNRPALVIAHNKTLAAQLCNELRSFFPNNRVEYFVSYYDYYQPESYLPTTDVYIEKDMSINDEIDKLRNSATASLGERRDVIVVASVSCIYGLGAPEEYFSLAISLRPNDRYDRDKLLARLVELQYERKDIDFTRSSFRVRGDIVEIFPAGNSESAIRIEFFGDEVEKILEIEVVSGKIIAKLKHICIFPASHYAVGGIKLQSAIGCIERDLQQEVAHFKETDKLLEAQRLESRTNYDIEMMREVGYCSGIENYSRYFDGRKIGDAPFTLLDYFPEDFIVFIDESHMTLPQIRAMYHGDLSRKKNLVDYGFRLSSAYDNRPLTFQEFENKITQFVYISATPAQYEKNLSAENYVEQIIRPTGLLDPYIEVRPIHGQIDNLMTEIQNTVQKGGRVLITTLTKKMAESLTDYLKNHGIKVQYMHSDIDTLARIEIVSGLRSGEFDVLCGINLLREGLDMPEVELVAILDADKEGFLRSDTALIQTIGRAARNINGRVIMYADTITGSMERAISETERRRKIQNNYNMQNNITPKTIVKDIVSTLHIRQKEDKNLQHIALENIPQEIEKLKALMKIASNQLDFERAIEMREAIHALKKRLKK